MNGIQLKLNQVSPLHENSVISFGPPNFATDFIYQFSTNENCDIQSKTENNSLEILSTSPSTVSLVTDKNHLFESTNLVSSSIVDNKMDENQPRINDRKIKSLEKKMKSLEDKLNQLKKKRLESRIRFKKMKKQMRLIQFAKARQMILLKNTKSILIKERAKKKELIKKLADQEFKQQYLQSIELSETASSTLTTTKKDDETLNSEIVKKYNELFTDDLICPVCLELMVEPGNLLNFFLFKLISNLFLFCFNFH